METVTVYHGTSEGYLDTLIRHGFHRPAVSANDMARQIIADLLPAGTPITDTLIAKIGHLSRMGYRAMESNSGSTLFATGRAETAWEYCTFSEHGGEIYAETARDLSQQGYHVSPRFPNARPVLLAIEVPLEDIDARSRAMITRDGSGKCIAPDSYEIFIQDTRRVKIKSVTMGRLPPLHPDQAAREIAPHLRIDAQKPLPHSEKQAVLDTIYGFRHDPHCTIAMIKMGSYDIPVAETVTEGADGVPVIRHVPDPRFKPAHVQLAESGIHITAAHQMPYGLAPYEMRAYLDIIDIRHARGEINAETRLGQLKKLWTAFQHDNPSLVTVNVDTTHVPSINRALTLAIDGAVADDITQTVGCAPDIAYAALRARCVNAYGLGSAIPWNPAPATLNTLVELMGKKVAQYEAASQPAVTPTVLRTL